MSTKSIGKILLSNGLPKRRTRINLGGTHISTMDFGHFKIVHSSLLMPGDKVNMSVGHNIRLAPMLAPTLGECDLTLRSFFVPARVAQDGFHEFISNTKKFTNNGSSVPSIATINNTILASWFTRYSSVYCPISPEREEGDVHWDSQFKDIHYVKENAVNLGVQAYLCAHTYNASNSFDQYMTAHPLTEVIGVCKNISANGEMVGFRPVTDIYHQNGHYLPQYGGLKTADELPMYDFIAMPAAQNATSANKITQWIFPWQIIKEAENTDFPNGELYPYCVYRFTQYGKRVYDFLLSNGYGINFNFFDVADAPVFNSTKTTNATVSVPHVSFLQSQQGLEVGYMFLTSTSTGTFNKFAATHFASSSGVTYDNVADPYKIMSITYSVSASVGNQLDDTIFNLLPIQSWLRIHLDWLVPTQFLDSYLSEERVKFGSGIYTDRDLCSQLLRSLTCSYRKDYFTTAWQEPNAPLTGTSANNMYMETDGGTMHLDTSAGHSENLLYTSNQRDDIQNISTGLSSLAIRAVNALTKWRRIQNVTGLRSIDNLLARFGVRPSDERINRSEFIDQSKSHFDISLVMSQSDTSTAALGDFAAHAESRDSHGLGSYTATEWGYLIIVASIVPKVIYYQGRDRHNLYVNNTDFLVPEFDEIDAMQSIRQDELFAENNVPRMLRDSYSYYKPKGVFGYSRLWAEMKQGRDLITGDFRLNTRGKYTNEAYHFGRSLPGLAYRSSKQTGLINNDLFNTCNDSQQFDRIFQFTNVLYDHFFMYFVVDVNCSRNTKSITDYTMNDENDDTRMTSSQMFGTQLN